MYVSFPIGRTLEYLDYMLTYYECVYACVNQPSNVIYGFQISLSAYYRSSFFLKSKCYRLFRFMIRYRIEMVQFFCLHQSSWYNC